MSIEFIREELNDQGDTGNEYYKVISDNKEYIVVKCFDYGGTLCDVNIANSDLDMEDVFSIELRNELWEETL